MCREGVDRCAMSEPDHQQHKREAVEEAAEHADRAGQARREMRQRAILAEETDNARRASELEHEAETLREEAYEQEEASADPADEAD